MYNQFDIVQIITTKRVKYLSGPKNYTTNPHGNWSVVGFVDNEILIAKDQTMVKIPVQDVRKVGSLDKDEFFKKLETAGFKPQVAISMAPIVSKRLSIGIDEAKSILTRYNFREEVSSREECEMIINRIRRLIEKDDNYQPR